MAQLSGSPSAQNLGGAKKARKLPWVVILGAGWGGLSVAAELDQFMEKNPGVIQAVVIDRKHEFTAHVGNQFALLGRSRPEKVSNSFADLSLKHVFFVQDEIVRIDRASSVVLGRGHKFRYDKLVIALGAETDHSLVEGMRSVAYDVSDISQVMQLKDALADFRGGDIVVSACQSQHSGPTSPYTYAMLIKQVIKLKGQEKVEKNTRVILTTPDSSAWPEHAPEVMLKTLEEKGILFMPKLEPLYVDTLQKALYFKNGDKLQFDVLVSSFPTKAPKVLVESGFCAADRFVSADPFTLRTDHAGVYCVGDCAELALLGKTKWHPKAGEFARAQGRVVAADIIKSLEAADGDEKWERAIAYVRMRDAVNVHAEVGGNQALVINCSLYNVRNPDSREAYTVSQASKENMKDLVTIWQDCISQWFAAPPAQ